MHLPCYPVLFAQALDDSHGLGDGIIVQVFKFQILAGGSAKHHHLIPLGVVGHEVRIVRVREDEDLEFEYLDDYPIAKAVTIIKRLGEKYGITKQVQRALNL